jgi:lipopolysaccharide/colanic/teichoic acid biosynthesis glycosyltransferase
MNRILDLLFSLVILIFISPLLFITLLVAAVSSLSTGVFLQIRIGQNAKRFTIYKFRTLKKGKVTRLGSVLRKTKLDELPQLFNILKGDMTFVGPRPDVPGYYDQLNGKDRRVLQLKPGLTSLAAIKYCNEEELLSRQEHPKMYNDKIIFPDKVAMNLEYLEKRSLLYDLKIIGLTFISLVK